MNLLDLSLDDAVVVTLKNTLGTDDTYKVQ
jgi:hypothetical protein